MMSKRGRVLKKSRNYEEKAKSILKMNADLIRKRYEKMNKKVIAVLGSFDTWSYMDYISREIGRIGHYAVTSLRCYFTVDGELKSVERGRYFRDMLMRESLRFMIFDEVHEAIIVYSIPGAHYIETEWCLERINKDANFRCFGITFVRKIEDENNCPYLRRVSELNCTECTAKSNRTAWDCIEEKGFCPFKDQGVAKNVIEYFFINQRARLFSIEKLEAVPLLLKSLL